MSRRPGADPCPSAGVAVAQAWHVAEPEDEQRLLGHLAGCTVCEAVIADALTVGAQLGAAVPPHDPPAALGERILAAVTTPLPARTGGRAPGTPTAPTGGRWRWC